MLQVSHALLLSFCEKYLLLLLNLASTMLLARMLTPDEIGVYALGAVLAGLLQALRDFGVGSYLIRAVQLSVSELRAALAASLLVASALALSLFLLSWPAASFYHDARVGMVLRWLALNFLLLPYAAMALALLRRQLQFGAILAINLSSAAMQLLVAVLCAWAGQGYRSLVWGATAAAVTTLGVSIWLRPAHMPWRPSLKGLAQVLRFGSVSTFGSVVDELGVATPELILGRLADVAQVAIFGKAAGLLSTFNQLVTSAVSPVIFPWFSAQTRAGSGWQQAYLRTAGYMAALAWPFFGFIALNAELFVRLLYGKQWDACIPLIRLMCIGSALYSMFSMARYLLLALGAVAAQARLDSIAVAARVGLLLLAAPHGLQWVALAVVAGSLVRCGCTLVFLWQQARIKPLALLQGAAYSLLITMLSLAIPLLLAHGNWQAATLLQLLAMAASMLPGWLLGVHLLYPELLAAGLAAGYKAANRLRNT